MFFFVGMVGKNCVGFVDKDGEWVIVGFLVFICIGEDVVDCFFGDVDIRGLDIGVIDDEDFCCCVMDL